MFILKSNSLTFSNEHEEIFLVSFGSLNLSRFPILELMTLA